MGKKLLEKAGHIGAPRPAVQGAAGTFVDSAVPVSVVADPARAKTAPGTMLGFMTAQSSAIQEAEQLRGRLQAFEGATPTRRLDAASIRPSPWANRHAASYQDAAFAELKVEIASAGGNVQPIKVRPLPAASQGVGRSNPLATVTIRLDGVAADAAADYEIVYGHRRHRACLELGLPVLALVEEVAEQQLFVEMERENRSRKDLSAWEQGAMYARALDLGLYPSNRQLALAIGRDLGDVGKALALARLPQVVVEAFASPLDLQYRWAKPLADAQQRDPEALIARAKALRRRAATLSARQVYEALVAEGTASKSEGVGLSNPAPASVPKAVVDLSVDRRGHVTVQIGAVLDEPKRAALRALIERFLAE